MKKKLNQKGMTAVELLVTFTILSFVIVGLFDVVLNYKDKEQKESVRNAVIDYENKLQKTIQDDLIKKHLSGVTYDNNINTDKIGVTINMGVDSIETSQLVIDFSTNMISYGASDNIINYAIPTFSSQNNTLTLNKDNTYIETRGTDKPFFVIKIAFDHPDFEDDELSFSIICPINYPTGS